MRQVMTLSRFWEIIELSKIKGPDSSADAGELQKQLEKLDILEIKRFDDILKDKTYIIQRHPVHCKQCDDDFEKCPKAGRADHHHNPKLVDVFMKFSQFSDFFSSDGFEYFTYWIIGRGKQVFELVKHNQYWLIDNTIKDPVYGVYNESLMYAAQKAYEIKTGLDDWYELESIKRI